MRRLARRLLTLCSTVSLLLCGVVVAAALLDLAEVLTDRVSYNAGYWGLFVSCAHSLGWQHGQGAEVLGFTLKEHHGYAGPVLHLKVPSWFLGLLLVVAVAPRVANMAERRRRGGAGLCVTCGYDLRASPGRCPECGAAAKG
jgi:hypothetical protein